MLDRLAAGWRRRWWIAAALAALATALLGAAVGLALGWERAGIGAAAALGGLAAPAWWWRRRLAVDARAAARDLNRRWPELEESAELLVADDAALSPVARLQRERTRRALQRLAPRPLPHRPLRWALWYAGAAAAVAAAALLLAGSREPLAARITTAAAPSGRALAFGDVRVEIQPPGYTGLPRRRQRAWAIEAPAGSAIRWRLEAAGAAAGALIASPGDTVALEPDGAAFTAALTPERSALYVVTLRDATGAAVTSDFHELTILPDAAPTVTVLEPEPRTLIQPGAVSVVRLRVLVGDDYGIAGTRLVATLTTGQGEGVKFREQELEFDRRGPRPDRRPGVLLERAIDPRAMGLGPGDELYFHVIARDVRQPVANETRSETYFITLVDTARALVADFSGLAVNLVPEYFRSQRQIIIDTERLLAERARLSEAEFRARSENIGLDQHLLRLRYGEIVGDEVVAGDADPQETHQHDIEDNATRLAPQVKATLQGALAQMWDAELRLRTSDPQAALPFEYRALELLKEVQQAARVYVRRVGFEPPPLEPDRKRLTGDLSKVGRPRVARDVAARDSLPAVRAALAVVRRLAAGAAPRPADAPALERSGSELAAVAVQEPGRHLETLRQLRALLDALRSGTACAACLPALEAGLLRALPQPDRAPGEAPPVGGLARRYFDLLRAP